MSNLEFNQENSYTSNNSFSNKPRSKVTEFLIKNKIAKDENGAQKVMLTVIVVCLCLTAYILFLK